MTQPADASDLQFDRAEFSGQPAAQTCAECQQPIVDSYFDINGQITCPACRETIAITQEGKSAWTAPFIALAAGLAAGVVGALLYYAILKITGYQIGLIAIVVGLLVGRAVRWGSGERGGRLYQVMAVAITYFAIVVTYVPFILEGVRNQAAQEAALQRANADGRPAQAPAQTPAQAPTAPLAQTPATLAADAEPMTVGGWVIAIVLLILLLLATPFLAGLENIIGLLILGFALWEAWKVNRHVPLTIAGPFALVPAGAAGGAAVPPIPTVPPPVPPADLPPTTAAG